MYRLLVVDDEAYALKSVMETVDWGSLGITRVYGALDVEEARTLLRQHSIDVVISDIEMPGENGLDLLRWMKEAQLPAETIFLTGHERFDYAQAALQMGCFNYLLKPIDHERLRDTVAKALHKLKGNRESAMLLQRMGQYEHLIKDQKQALVERLWSETIDPAGPTHNGDNSSRQLVMLEPELSADNECLSILISIDRWKEQFVSKDEDILEYAILNSAREIILEDWPGAMVKNRAGDIFIILYSTQRSDRTLVDIRRRCRQLIDSCSSYFYSLVKCYIGESVPVTQLAANCSSLLILERQCANGIKDIWMVGEVEPAYEVTRIALPGQAWPVEIPLLLQKGKKKELLRTIDEWFAACEKERVLSKRDLKALYYHLLSALYHSFNNSGMPIGYAIEAISNQGDMSHWTKSLAHLHTWTKAIIETTMSDEASRIEREPGVVKQIELYVQSRMSEDVTREDIAALLHFHPAYLSRLFKKETGLSLTDYIVSQRMKHAKKLLSESNLKVSDVAEITGYNNFSYFSRLFKKQEGYTPIEFRRRNKR